MTPVDRPTIRRPVMPITYSFDAAGPLIRTVVTGDARLPDIAGHLNAISAEPWFPAPALVDTRQAAIDIPTPEVHGVVEMFRALAPRLNGAPIAVVVPSDAAFGLVRMMELMLDGVVTIEPFHDTASALAWLAASSGPRPPLHES